MKQDTLKIKVDGDGLEPRSCTVDELLELPLSTFDIGEVLPGLAGRAFSLNSLYKHICLPISPEVPAYVKVEAADEFEAIIPWSECGAAVFLYEQDGRRDFKGAPLRLYVPNGSSDCLNVKSVVHIRFLDSSRFSYDKGVFGFKNVIPIDQLQS